MNIIIVGIGGAGISILNNILSSETWHFSTLALDIDKNDLAQSLSKNKILLPNLLGSIANDSPFPPIAQLGVLEKREEIKAVLQSADRIFLIAGMGGSCGTGAVVEIAKITSEIGVPTTIITTTPFHFEGKNRQELAKNRISDLRKISKNVVVVHNEDTKNKLEGKVTFASAFSAVDDFVVKTIQDQVKLL